MADKRKLQGEIERCLKRVAEGVEQFEDIWQKVHNASNANQKEKYEADLKKEIKKLQRLRDQIKTWLTSNDIKDKSPLMENRRLIETQMERFKIVERETKTKAYSKEGLGLATKVDPAQREKEEVRVWLTDSIDKLNLQIDQFESEVESVYAGSRKKKLDRDRSDRVEELQGWVERHKFHIQKLETMMRMMDNCSLETDSIKQIQDDLNYYVDCNQEPDFAENELIYEDLDLDEASAAALFAAAAIAGATHPPVSEEEMNSIPTSPTTSSQGGPLSPKTPTTMKSTSQELFEERRRGKTSISSIEHLNEVPSEPQSQSPVFPLSPKKPTSGNKTFLPNSSLPSRSNSTDNNGKSATTSSEKGNSLPNSKGSSASQATTPSSANGSSSQRGLSKPAQPPSGPAYAIAAGGHQNSLPSPASTPSSSLYPVTQTAVTPSSSQTQSSSPPLPSASSQIPTSTISVTCSVEINSSNSPQPQQPSPQSQPQTSITSQPRPQVPVSLQLQHSRSSSGSSSLSPSTLSQESQPAPPQLPSSTAAVESAVVTVDTSSNISVPSSGSSTSMQHSQVGTPTSESGAITMETSHHTHSSPSNQSSSLSPNSSSSLPAPPSSPAPHAQPQVASGWPDQTSSKAMPGRTPMGEALTVSTSATPLSASLAPVGTSTSSGALQGLPSLPQLPLMPSLPSEGGSGGNGLLPVWMSAGSVGGLPSMVTLSSMVSMGSSTGLLTQTTPASMVSSVSMASSSVGETQSGSTTFTSAITSATPSTPTLAPTLFSSAGFLSSESLPTSSEASDSLSSLKSIAAQVVASNRLSVDSKPESSGPMIRPLFDPTMAAPGTRLEGVAQTRTDTQLQPLLGVTPLGPVQLSQEKLYQLKMLEGACKHMPQPSDSERVRPYLQRTPYPTHYYHHQHPPPHFDSFEFFQRLSIETLFFIFYYMEGTKAQYMAAKALKKLSWRFHTKYMMWFQRLEEPKAITDDYEMGTYIYFDFEKWSQRKKEGFTFEYRYLEDKDLP